MAFDSLVRLRYFIAFAETGRISTVATLFDVNESSVSRALHSLQKSSKSPLFISKGRNLELTSFGLSFYHRLKPIVNSLEIICEEILINDQRVEGKIRLSTAHGFASTALLDLLDRFRHLYPGVKIDATIGHGLKDLLSGNVDIVTVTGSQSQNSELVFLERGVNRYIPLASAEFVSTNGPLNDIEDLNHVRVFAYAGKERAPTKYLYRGGVKREINLQECSKSDSLHALKTAAISGKGVVLDLPYFFCSEELKNGSLVPVLDGWEKPAAMLYTVTTKTLWKNPRFRIFAEWFSEESKKIYDIPSWLKTNAGK